MPREESNINHVALTDHRILRAPKPSRDKPPVLSPTRLLPFGKDHFDASDPELARDWAVATIDRARNQGSIRNEVSRIAGPLLANAVQRHPEDLNARDSLAVALVWMGDLDGSLTVCEGTIARAPRREQALCDAGVTAQRLGFTDRSLAYWQRALAINPASSRYRFEVASLLAQRGEWEPAAAECRKVLEKNGTHVGCRLILVHYFLQKNQRTHARAELEIALLLHPPNEAELRKTFEELLR
jgi:tetratricopeptide (TPR) repeat protein